MLVLVSIYHGHANTVTTRWAVVLYALMKLWTDF